MHRSAPGLKDHTILLLIMPQEDFHPPFGSLQVPGAREDSARTAALIKENYHAIDEIIVLQDSHHLNDIAHPGFWVDPHGNQPSTFTAITNQDVVSGRWTPRDPSLLTHAKYYTQQLTVMPNNFPLLIWPVHCLIGSEGHAIVEELDVELQNWAGATNENVDYILKGKSTLTEMYSAIEAEVPIPSDPSTHIDWGLLDRLKCAKQVLVCGQAKSHCVTYTTKSIMKYWRLTREQYNASSSVAEDIFKCPDRCEPDCKYCYQSAEKLVLLVDATSNVADLDPTRPTAFKDTGDALEALVERKGGRLRKTVAGDTRYPKVELDTAKLEEATEKE